VNVVSNKVMIFGFCGGNSQDQASNLVLIQQ
jgi:hypothetical protein